jgi:hypothetical protein
LREFETQTKAGLIAKIDDRGLLAILGILANAKQGMVKSGFNPV